MSSSECLISPLHLNHKELYYYPSFKFEFGSNAEKLFFTTSKWKNQNNYDTVKRLYSYIEEYFNTTEVCPCLIIVAFRLIHANKISLGDKQLTRRQFDNDFAMKNKFFIFNINLETKLKNINILLNQSEVFYNKFTNLTGIPIDEVKNILLALRDSIKIPNCNLSKQTRKNRITISKPMKKYIDDLYLQLNSCVSKKAAITSKHQNIYLQLAYFVRTGSLDNFNTINVLKLPQNRQTKQLRGKFFNLLKQQFSNDFCLNQNSGLPHENRMHLFYNLRHTKLFRQKNDNVCRHSNLKISFEQTRCSDEIDSTVRYCLDCRRII